MKTLKSISLFVLTISLMLLFSCQNQGAVGKGNESVDQPAEKLENVKAVCIYNYSKKGMQVLKEDKDSHMTFIQLGEIATLLGETDSILRSDRLRKYSKIELSDGKRGWAMSNYLVPNAEPATIIGETPIYERANPLNITSKTFSEVEIVAIVETQDDWYNVVGINKIKKGWIKKGVVSKDEKDIVMANLAIREVYDSKLNLLTDKIEEFVETAPYPESQIVNILKSKLQEEIMEEAAELVEESEMVDDSEMME